MKLRFLLAIVLTFTCCTGLLAAQAPAGSTGQCKDGSYTTAAKKSGACSGHKGVQTWFAATGSAPTTTNAMAPGQEPSQTGAPAQKQAPTPSSPNVMTAPAAPASASPNQPKSTAEPGNSKASAPGGGPGMVWVNTSTKVYHCPGKEFYGTTKNGKYMSEADATAMGARADHNKPCPK